ncbi:hypothetical protein ATERTT37_000345 [Aspergillus terreus]
MLRDLDSPPSAHLLYTAFKGRLRAKAEFMSIENLKTFGKCFCHLPSCGLVVIPSDRLPVERLDPVGDGSSILYRLVSVARYRRHRRLRSIIINALYRGGVVGIWFAGLRLTRALDTDPFAEADEDTGETKQSQNYIHIRIQQRNGRKTLTTVQGLPKKFDQKKILKVIKKKFACNGTIVADSEMGEVIQLQGDQRKDVQEFLTDKKEGLELDAKTIKVHGF